MMKVVLIVLFGALVVSCSLPDPEVRVYSISYAFADSAEDWTGDFSRYAADTTGYHLHFAHETLAYSVNSDSSKKAMYFSGINTGNGLFMFMKTKVYGLRKNTTYQILFNVRFASHEPASALGTGDAPGEMVYVKAGATTEEPQKILTDGVYKLNIDIGEVDEDGQDMITLGNIAGASSITKFTLLVRNNNSLNSVFATTNDAGELWLIVGSDSGFVGETALYFTQVDVLFNQVN